MALVPNSDSSLKNFFSNPDDSPFCARCILGASQKGMKRGQATHGSKAFWSNSTQDLDFWRSLMRFLFSVRTEEQTRQLLDHLNRCSCYSRSRDPRIVEYHRSGRTVEANVLKLEVVETQTPSVALITNFFYNLMAALDGTHLKAVAKRTATHWPTCPEDLMPFGPESLVESIIIWSRFIPDTIIFRFTAECIRFCGALLIPFAIDSALTRHVIDAGRQLFDLTWATIRVRAVPRRAAVGQAFAHQINPLLQYFTVFYDMQRVEKQMVMLDGYEMKAVQVFSLLAYAADDPRLLLKSPEPSRSQLAECGCLFYRSMNHYIDPLPPILVHPSMCELQAAMSRAIDEDCSDEEVTGENSTLLTYCTPAEPDSSTIMVVSGDSEPLPPLYGKVAKMTINHIRDARFDLCCSARGCPNSIQSTGREFQRCIGCNVALYCSKKCQADAWNYAEFPHKIICKLLANVVAVAGSELLFRCPTANSTYYPDDLMALVIENLGNGHVKMADLMKITGWASYKMYPAPLSMKAECEPGFADYDEKLSELSERGGASKAEYLVLEKLTADAKVYHEMRHIVNSVPAGSKMVTLGYAETF